MSVKLTNLQIQRINATGDSIEVEINKEGLLKQMLIWHKLSTPEQTKILNNNFGSEIGKDNYVHSLIMKYL